MKSFKLYFILFIFLGQGITSFSQELKFYNLPENYQLYARDSSNNASVLISGEVIGVPDFKKLTLKVFKNDVLFDSKEDTLQNKKFSITTKVDAGLHQFRFELYLQKNSKDSLYLTVDNVVCGDAYIISGQSNSHASSSLSTYSSPYCRSFGVKTGYETYNEEDKKVRWGLATGNLKDLEGIGGWFKKNPFGVGVWGMELMKLIVEKHKVPVCIINGGSGSSSIEQNMLYPEKPSLETSFGRLAYRVDQAGLKDKIKAILWHQGETNTNTEESYLSYSSNFKTLVNDWKRVYTGLEKVYLFQLHPGCGGDYASEFREIQYQIANQNEMVNIMSTTGVIGHDGCHFSYEGYLEFAHRISPLVSRDFYNQKTNAIITPPILINAFYKNKKEIVLEFNQPIFLEEKKEVKGKIHYIKEQFFFGTTTDIKPKKSSIESIKIANNSLTLTLKNGVKYQDITYLPNKVYENTTDIYNGPWIRGAQNNLGALSFHRKKIQ
tara:strand:+ start:305 stop:1783 length:1479 start_codon:yes stop_codon:yes gene_type:complete